MAPPTSLRSEIASDRKERTVSHRADRYAARRSSRAVVAWLLIAGMGFLLIALGNEAMHSLSARLGGRGSVMSANGPVAGPATSERRAKVVPGTGAFDRTRIRVLLERRAHSDEECVSFGRVPIGVMIACHQKRLHRGGVGHSR